MSTLAILIPLAVIGSYVVISSVLFRFPHILHKRRKSIINASLIAHRGGAGENLENTITAFKHAIKHGMHMLELDCQLTNDRQVVVSHDNNIERTTGEKVLISDTDYQDLPKIKTDLEVSFCRDTWCHSQSEDCQIPLLSEVFTTFPDVPINLDIKEENPELIEKVLEVIKKNDREAITVVGNFRESITTQVRKKAPNIPTIFSLSSIMKLVLCCYTGLLPFVTLKDSFLEIPVGKEIRRNLGDIGPWYFRALLRIYDGLLIHKFLFNHLQRRGIKIYLWVMNDATGWETAHQLGVDGVMTDFPKLLKEFVDQQQYVFPPKSL